MSRRLKFRDMPYERPDATATKQKLFELANRLRKATSYEEARELFFDQQQLEIEIDTLSSLASIRHSIDTRDTFYDAEQQFWDEFAPELEEAQQAWTLAMLQCPFRPSFENEFGTVMFTNAEIEARSFSPCIIDELQQEGKLTTEYAKLIASAQIPFQDDIYTISQLAPFKTSADDTVRNAAWIAEGSWYKEQQSELDRIYDQLVRLRDSMGQKLGHDSFIPLGYDRMRRNCYTKDDVERFRAAVVKHLVPICESIYRKQAERTGLQYPLSFADAALMFRSGNPRPCGNADDILAEGKRFYDELSPLTSEYFNGMLDGELLDVLSTEGKEGGGYCSSLLKFEMPFIFANFNGTQADVEVITHEAGHGFAAWLNRKRIPISCIWPTMEACEVHSMSMEFFAWPWCEGFFGADARKYRYSHLAGAITFIPYGTMVDHFQHLVYETPGMTPKDRHATWKRLLGIYMPWMRLDGEIPFYADGEGWQRQLHIYEVPFYYIDYCLAQTVALELWAMMQEDRDEAWQHYLSYTEQGGSKTFVELLNHAGLVSPFDEQCLKTISERASRWLDDYDLTGIE